MTERSGLEPADPALAPPQLGAIARTLESLVSAVGQVNVTLRELLGEVIRVGEIIQDTAPMGRRPTEDPGGQAGAR